MVKSHYHIAQAYALIAEAEKHLDIAYNAMTAQDPHLLIPPMYKTQTASSYTLEAKSDTNEILKSLSKVIGIFSLTAEELEDLDIK